MFKKQLYIDTEKPMYLNALRSVFKQSDGTQIQSTPLKYDKKAVLYKITCSNQIFVVKHYPHLTFLSKLRSSRAKRCYTFAKQLKQLGIQTPHPIALIEERKGPFTYNSYFITECINGKQAYNYFASENDNADNLKTKIQDELMKLKNHSLLHNDLKLVNILVDENSEPYLVDLDAMRKRRPILDNPMKDLNRFEQEVISSKRKYDHPEDQ